jgi:hypothetical protein
MFGAARPLLRLKFALRIYLALEAARKAARAGAVRAAGSEVRAHEVWAATRARS